MLQTCNRSGTLRGTSGQAVSYIFGSELRAWFRLSRGGAARQRRDDVLREEERIRSKAGASSRRIANGRRCARIAWVKAVRFGGSTSRATSPAVEAPLQPARLSRQAMRDRLRRDSGGASAVLRRRSARFVPRRFRGTAQDAQYSLAPTISREPASARAPRDLHPGAGARAS
jgi:hypothetical protein